MVYLFSVPAFLLPSPDRVILTLFESMPFLFHHAMVTAFEMLAGLLIGTWLGVSMGLLLLLIPPVGRWLFPLFITSQALPVFALAPLLTLWLGFGFSAKIAMACLIIYFPIVSNFYDGLRRTHAQYIYAAKSMGANDWQTLIYIRFAFSLPYLGSGLKIAATVTPIGVIVGEWVGGSQGLGYLMIYANGRMDTDLMFAALLMIMLLGLGLHMLVQKLADFLPKLPSKLF